MSKQKKKFKECISKIEMKEYKNFKVLCEEIGYPEPKGGNSRKSTLKVLNENFIMEKDGNKIIFKKKIAENIKTVQQFAKDISLRQKLIELGILKHILESQNNPKQINIFNMDTTNTNYFSLTEILFKLGMINKQYYAVKINNSQFDKQAHGEKEFEDYNYSLAHKENLEDFFKVTHQNYSNIIKSAMDSLKKQNIIDYRRNTIMAFTKLQVPQKSFLSELSEEDYNAIMTAENFNPYISKEETIKLYNKRNYKKKKEDNSPHIYFSKISEYCDSDMINRIAKFKTTAWNKAVAEFEKYHDKHYPDKEFILKKDITTFTNKLYGYMNSNFKIMSKAVGKRQYTLGEIFAFFLNEEFNKYFKENNNSLNSVYLYNYDYQAYDVITGSPLNRTINKIINEILEKDDNNFNRQQLNELTIEKLLKNADRRFKNDEDYNSKIKLFTLYSKDLINLANDEKEVSIFNDPLFIN